MAEKHTPGPWRLSPYYGRKDEPVPGRYQGIYEPIPGMQYGARSCIVTVGIKGDVDDYWLSINPADAALISAAPDMLEALKASSQFIENGIELGYIRMPDAGTPDPAHKTPDIINAAIAKAEGRE